MSATRTRKIPLDATRSYDAPRGLRRVQMTANPLGVQMLAAVNGRGAYETNGRTKRARKKARRARAKAQSWSRRARASRGSRGQRSWARKKAKKGWKKARKHADRYQYESTMKRLAKRAGMKKRDFEEAWAKGWLSKGEKKAAQKEAKREERRESGRGGAREYDYAGGSGDIDVVMGGDTLSDMPASMNMNPGRGRHRQIAGLRKYYRRIEKHAGAKKAAAQMRKRFGSRLAKEAIEGAPMAGKRKRRRAGGSKRRRRASTKRRTKRSSGRSRARKSRKSRKTRRSSGKRRSRSRGKSRSRGRSRGRMRRNGSPSTAAGQESYNALLSSYGLSPSSGGSGLTPNKRRGKSRKKWASGKKSRKWGRGKSRKSYGRKGRGGGGGYGGMLKKLAKRFGIPKDMLPDYDEYSNPLAGPIVEAVSRGISDPDKKDKAIRAVVDELYGKQYRKVRAKVPVEIADPITGETRTHWVPVRHKAQVRFGPYSRRMYKGRLSYESKKGKHIPKWALAGAPSKEYYDANRDFYDNVFSSRYSGERDKAATKAQEKMAKRVAKLLSEGDTFVANKRGGKRRRGKGRGRARGSWRKRGRKGGRRMSGRGRRKLSRLARGRRRNKRGQFRRNGKRRGSRRGKRRGSKRRSSKRRGRGGKRRSSKRRGRGKRRSRGRSRGKGRRRGRGRRRGGLRMRRNAFMAAVQQAFKSGLPYFGGFLAHRVGVWAIQNFGLTGMLPASVQPYANLISAVAVAALGIGILDSTCPFGADTCDKASVGMAVSTIATAIGEVGQMFGLSVPGLSGIGWENTSGWGRPFGEYELRGLGRFGEYELRGLGGGVVQAAAGLGYTQAAAGLGYTQAAAGLGGGVVQAAAGYGAYELRGLDGVPTFDGLRPENADQALTESERWSAATEYRNSQMQPNPALFSEDRLTALGVPRLMMGGVGTESIWLPEDPSVRVGSIQGGGSSADFLPPRALPPAPVIRGGGGHNPFSSLRLPSDLPRPSDAGKQPAYQARLTGPLPRKTPPWPSSPTSKSASSSRSATP